MSYSLANPLGWASGDKITPAQINQLDAEHASAIDGSGGGTYTLSSPLTLNGSTVNIATLSATTATVTGNVTIGTTTANTLTINSSINGSPVFSGSPYVTGVMTVVGRIAFDPGGGIIGISIKSVTAGGTSVSINSYSTILIGSAVSTGTTTTLTGTGGLGAWFEVRNNSANAHNIAGLVSASLSAGEYRKYAHDGGSWVRVQ